MESLVPSTCRLVLPPRHSRNDGLARWLRLTAEFILVLSVVRPLFAGSAGRAGKSSAPAVSAADPAGADPVASDPLAASSSSVDPPIMDPLGSSSETVLLEVVVNGHSNGQIGEFYLRRGTLYARPQQLRDLGFRIPASARGLIALNDLRGLTWTMDAANQRLLVTAIDAALIPTVLLPSPANAQELRRPIESGTGMTLNYDAVGTFGADQTGGSSLFDMRNFSPWGITSSDWMTYAGAARQGTKSLVRLDSQYTFDDVKSLRRYSVGDYIDSSLNWARPVRMEGLQIRSDFSMRPDLITFPLPVLNGSAAVPSTVDVLVNGNVAASSEVGAGPFEVQQLPVISGEGTITMNLTNAQGGQVTVTQPFYGAPTLLAKGLQTFAAQAGLVRREWGTLSNDYGKLAAAAYYRRGISQLFTIEGTSEATPGAFMTGGGGSVILWNRALVNFDLAASGGSAGPGGLVSVGLQHQGRIFGLGGSASLANSNYRDIAAMNGSPIPRKQISLFSGFTFRRFGSLAVAYAQLSQSPPPVQVPIAFGENLQSRILSANYTHQFHHISFFATEFRDLNNASASGLQLTLSLPIGRQRSASVSGSSTGAVQVQSQQSVVVNGDWGYQAYLSAGNGTQSFGVVQYKSPIGLFSAGVNDSLGQNTVRLETQGALSLVDRAVFPSNTIYDSFAIVDTAPLGKIHVYQENRDVGTTSKSGRLLVPDMRSFEINQIGIEPKDVPADADLALDKRTVRPQDRSGVVIRFPIKFSHGALLKLVGESGLALPLGSTVTLLGSSVLAPVGYDGQAYIEGLSAHNRIAVELPSGVHCTAMFDYKPAPGDIPTIGPLRCQEVKP